MFRQDLRLPSYWITTDPLFTDPLSVARATAVGPDSSRCRAGQDSEYRSALSVLEVLSPSSGIHWMTAVGRWAAQDSKVTSRAGLPTLENYYYPLEETIQL